MTDKKKPTSNRMVIGGGNNGYVKVLIASPSGGEPVEARANWTYTQAIGEHICEQIQNGMTLTKICKMPGMPSIHVVNYWRENKEEFRTMYEAARKYRAERRYDRVMDEIDKVREGNSKAKKVILDGLKWAAKVDDPLVYGDIKKEVGDNAPGGINIYVNTGINRPAIEVEAKPEVKEIESIPVEENNGENTDAGN